MGYYVSFNEAVHYIVTRCANGPNTLEHLALKAVLANNLPLDGMPKLLQQKAEKGMFSPGYFRAPENLTDEGWWWYEVVKTFFGVDDGNEFRHSLEERENGYCARFPNGY